MVVVCVLLDVQFYSEGVKPKEGNSSFEVFNCPQWTYEITAIIRYVTLADSQVKIIKLTTGVSEVAFDIDISLVSITTPPQPIFGSCILYNKLGTFLAPCNLREYAPGRIGEIQCPTKLHADKLTSKCLMAQNLVNTNPGVVQVSCSSNIVDIEKTLLENKFPLKLEEVLLYEENGNIQANFPADAPCN